MFCVTILDRILNEARISNHARYELISPTNNSYIGVVSFTVFSIFVLIDNDDINF